MWFTHNSTSCGRERESGRTDKREGIEGCSESPAKSSNNTNQGSTVAPDARNSTSYRLELNTWPFPISCIKWIIKSALLLSNQKLYEQWRRYCWPAIFPSGINTHMPNGAGLGWRTTLVSIVMCFLLTVREGRCSNLMWENQLENKRLTAKNVMFWRASCYM